MTPTCDVESWANAGHVAAWKAAKEDEAMFDRFTDRARKALGEARSIAIETGVSVMTPDHLFLALLRDRDGLAARSLAVRCAGGFDLAMAQDKTLHLLKQRAGGTPASTTIYGAQVPHGPSLRRCFELASSAASRLRVNYIGTEHLLLGIIENHDYEPINLVLSNVGLTKSEVVRAVMTELGAQSAEESAPSPATFAAGTAPVTDAESSVRMNVTSTPLKVQDRRLESTCTTEEGAAAPTGQDREQPCVFTDEMARGVAGAVLEAFEHTLSKALESTVEQVKADFIAALDGAKATILNTNVALRRKD